MSPYGAQNSKIYGFRSITWAGLNQIKPNLDMLLSAIKGRLSSILNDIYFGFPELCPFMKYKIVKFRVMP